jgi:nitroreductase
VHLELWPGLIHKQNMVQFNDTSNLLTFLRTRKSGSAKAMVGPGPSASQLRDIFKIAVRVPDHGKLVPWRFISFSGDARGVVGQLFADRWAQLHPEHGPDSLLFQAKLFERAPLVVAVVSTAVEHAKIPVWEQQLSAAAVCYNLVLAASAIGFHAQWQSDWVAYDEITTTAMGLKGTEKIAGIIYIGTSTMPLEDRPRPDVEYLVTEWGKE